ncbi:MAG: amino-acid racemase [Firmicutes bacterium HGW-Firmicutes-12]|nr:MAG: amino-acid racemase [Firmicutes bacterium HGW-Firmicutes-12]
MTLVSELTTPSFLVDMDKLEQNIKEMGEVCKACGKQLWPMLKTHKSTSIAKMQNCYGAAGFLVGTIDEADKLVNMGYKEIMLAYPIADNGNIDRIIQLSNKAHFYLSFDGFEAAALWERKLCSENLTMDYLMIVDCGLHRFGVAPERAVGLAKQLDGYKHLCLKGISTHPGQVYGASCVEEVEKVGKEELEALTRAKTLLANAGYQVMITATGSTPTAKIEAQDKMITALRPGNYVFYDAIQVALGVVPEERCALTVLTTVISHPKPDLYIIDAGSKCFGLDKGAHGISLTKGFGIIKGYPELVVESLSEEVGKIKVEKETELKVGDKIEVIPNHACASANMTSFLIGHRNGIVEKVISIDARGGSSIPILK